MTAGYRAEISTALAIVALWTVAALAAPDFLAAANQRDLLMSNMPVLICALGMTLVMLTGHIDISVGSVFAICSVGAGVLAKSGLPWFALALAVPLVGAALGAFNGVLVAYVRLPSIVVTLATMVGLRDGLRWATEGAWVQDLPRGFQWFGWTLGASEAVTVTIAAILFSVAAWAMRNLAAGRAVYATGSNPEAARLAGIGSALVTFCALVTLGGLTGAAALLNAVRFSQIPSNSGLGMELKVIAAVVVGGTAIRGGRGTIVGTLLGVILLGSIGPLLTFLGVSAWWEKAVQGGVILAAVAADARRPRAPVSGGRLARAGA